VTDFKDQMIEAIEREGIDPEQAYEHVRDVQAMAADLDMPPGVMGPGNVGQVVLAKDRIWVNEERTVLVRLWAGGTMEVARRDDPSHTWGPPVYLTEEV
jgi:hypothetical protein